MKLGNLYYDGTETLAKDRQKALRYYADAYRKNPDEKLFSPELLYLLATAYQNGDGLEKDLEKATELFALAADKGYKDAMIQAGKCYLSGNGVQKDPSKAQKYFTMAVENGESNPELLYFLGDSYSDSGPHRDLDKAIKYLQMLDLQNNANAANLLGYCYGEKKEYAEAVKYFKIAADLNHVAANYNLGLYYKEGLGVEQDYTLSRKYYQVAADAGRTGAMLAIASFYKDGKGVAKDYNQAVLLYKKVQAADKQNVLANLALGQCYFTGGYGLEQNYTEAKRYFQNISQYQDVQYYLGLIAYQEKDESKALEYFATAAKNMPDGYVTWFESIGSCPAAEYQLGLIYCNGADKVAKDMEKGIKHLTHAAEQGSTEAQLYLGKSFLNGENGIQQDTAKGIQLLTTAAAKSRDAKQILAVKYYQDKDYATAAQWFEKIVLAESESSKEIGARSDAGHLFYDSGNYEKAAKYLKEAMEHVPHAKFLYAVCCYTGRGTEKNQELAIELFLQVSEKVEKAQFIDFVVSPETSTATCAGAYYALARLYRNRTYSEVPGGYMDNDSFRKYMTIAAEQKDPQALDYMISISSSPEESIKWQKILADSGDIQAAFDLGMYIRRLHSHFRTKELEMLGYRSFIKVIRANPEHAEALYQLGECWYEGFGVPQKKTLAKSYYRKAADAGHHNAKIKLNSSYLWQDMEATKSTQSTKSTPSRPSAKRPAAPAKQEWIIEKVRLPNGRVIERKRRR